MNAKQVKALQPNDRLYHKQYGTVQVVNVQLDNGGDLFGLVILPVTVGGMEIYMNHAGIDHPMPLLEDRYKLLYPLVTEAEDKLKAELGEARYTQAQSELKIAIDNCPEGLTEAEFVATLTGEGQALFVAWSQDLSQQKGRKWSK